MDTGGGLGNPVGERKTLETTIEAHSTRNPRQAGKEAVEEEFVQEDCCIVVLDPKATCEADDLPEVESEED